MSHEPLPVLITGASSGIGRAAVEYLAARDFQVYAGARDRGALEELSQIPNVTALRLDVTRPQEILAARQAIEAKGTGLFGLVNNAGITEAGPLMDVETDALRAQFEVNLFGVHAVTRTFFPLLHQSQGRIVMISSDSGFFATPFVGPYCASKFALEGYSDSLRRELTRHGVRVILIEPGCIATAIWDKARRNIDPEKYARSLFGKEALAVGRQALAKGQSAGLPPRAVAESIHLALTLAKPKLRYIVAKNSLEYKLLKILPGSYVDRLVHKKIDRALSLEKAG
ncbi:MAG: SDR family oxidoreductase [Desulfobacterales bacterium]|nr:SDR family oxidoreductase [Desulfobacterales bacterium]